MLVYTLITEYNKNNNVHLSPAINHQLFTSHHAWNKCDFFYVKKS